jgi:hypothetical protein
MFDSLAESIGLPEGINNVLNLDQIRLIILILAGLPCGFINYFITNPTLRLWYGFIVGSFLQYLMYGSSKK